MARIIGTAGSDQMGRQADGDLAGTNDSDEFLGAAGNDSIVLKNGDSGIGGLGDDTFNIEGEDAHARGDRGDDRFLIFQSGATAEGGRGDDTFLTWGGLADDLCLTGGTGADTFSFILGGGRPDLVQTTTIKDFSTRADKLTAFSHVRIAYSPYDSDFDGTAESVRVMLYGIRFENTRQIILEGVDLDAFSQRIGRIFCDENGTTFPSDQITRISLMSQPNSIFGGSDDFDSVEGSDGRQIIRTEGGDDVARGGNGNDILNTGSGNDCGFGGAQNDLLILGFGDDCGFGDAGNDTLRGGNGNDRLDGGAGQNRLTGGQGADDFIASTGAGSVSLVTDFDMSQDGLGLFDAERITFSGTDWGGDGDEDVLIEIRFGDGDLGTLVLLDSNIQDLAYADLRIFDSAGEAIAEDDIFGLPLTGDTITGSDEDDEITGTPLSDTIDAGAGTDTVHAGAGDDIILPSSGADMLFGGDGADQIFGNPGEQQFLLGEAGNDTLFVFDRNVAQGGDGTDTFRFLETASGATASAGDFDVFEDRLIIADGVTHVQFIDVSFPGTSITRVDMYFDTTPGASITLGETDFLAATFTIADWLSTESGFVPEVL